ncbi:MAG: diphthine--ammonia ligase [Candidatus Omnitrophota bacterium]|nr:diphthine--ammonia ligase [Candidatus Omnitrophota bacterium]
MDNLNAISSWSGGKDSCLACYKAMQEGFKIKYLLNFISREYKRCCFHGVEAALIKLQSELIGIPLIQKEVTSDMQKYEDEFKSAVCQLKGKDIKAMVFGDIYLLEHEIWIERVCRDIGIFPVEPLWNKPVSEILTEFVDAGFKSIVVSARADKFDKDFVGREVTKGFIEELSSRNICPCGENGEFHTLVIDGPIFKRPIRIMESASVLKEGFWKYWFLDIRKYN